MWQIDNIKHHMKNVHYLFRLDDGDVVVVLLSDGFFFLLLVLLAISKNCIMSLVSHELVRQIHIHNASMPLRTPFPSPSAQ